MKTTRTYTASNRARSVEETRRRILAASIDLHGERLAADIALDDIAERAGVSVQTLLRHFGSRVGLVEASFDQAREAVLQERRTPVGDVAAAVRVIVDHYELRGDGVLVMLAQEQFHELMRRLTDEGRRLHRSWVEEVFAPHLERSGDPVRLGDLLVVATDVYAWKLLRRDRGLSRARTEEHLLHLVHALLDSPARPSTAQPSPETP